MSTSLKAVALTGMLLLVATETLQAQQRRFVLAPEYAGNFELLAGRPHWGVSVQTFTARFSVQSWNRVSPGITLGFTSLDLGCRDRTNCSENGWILLPGARVDVLPMPQRAIARPYVIAGAGVVVFNEGSLDFLPSAGVGVRWAESSAIAPRLEVRWERYDDRDYAMVGLGVGIVLGRPVSAIRR